MDRTAETMTEVDHSIAPEPYYVLRAALSLYEKTPTELSEPQINNVKRQAENEYRIENRILQSDEASSVSITEETLSQALQQIRERFDGEETFLTVLQRNGLNLQALQSALLRQCKVERVMERVAARAASVTAAEVDLYYHLHPEKFNQPEQRRTAHILITVNPEFAENTHECARGRLEKIAQKLAKKPHLFAELAMKNSECPSALQGGELGRFQRGTLYPEIDQALFAMQEGQISDLIETEAGFHLLKCLQIFPANTMSLKKARPKIRKLMQDRQQQICQRAWLAQLDNPSSRTGHHHG